MPRLVIYFQTTHNAATGQPISMLPLITEQEISLTHLIVCSFHLGNQDSGGAIHLNDYPPDDPLFYTLWNETAILRAAGVKVMGMVGGAAPGSFSTDTLDSPDAATFEHYYGQLHDALVTYQLQGLDVDVEQPMSQGGITRLLTRLHADFGDGFVLTLAPVASALGGGGGPNLSGFEYAALAVDAVTADGAPVVDFFNAQFYNGFGSLDSPADYEAAVGAGWRAAELVAGQLTDAGQGDSAYFGALNQTVTRLMEEHGTFGGVMGWEYFNSAPGGEAAPWQWAQAMTRILRPTYAGQSTSLPSSLQAHRGMDPRPATVVVGQPPALEKQDELVRKHKD